MPGPQSMPSVVLCVLYQDLIVYVLVNPLLACWIYFCTFQLFLFLLQDYNLCCNGSPCYSSSYNYKSIWPYYIVIYITHTWILTLQSRGWALTLGWKLTLKSEGWALTQSWMLTLKSVGWTLTQGWININPWLDINPRKWRMAINQRLYVNPTKWGMGINQRLDVNTTT